MKLAFFVISGPLFLISAALHIYVKIKMRPKPGSDLDDYYYEFEERCPAYAKYLKWSRISLAFVVISMLLLFVAAVL